MNCNCECKMLNITAGTDITLAVTLRRDGKLFPVELSDSVKVNMVSQRGVRTSVSCRVGTGKVAIPLLGDDFAVGVYGVEITGVLNGAKWRTFGASVVKYTYETERGAARVIANGDTYDIELEVGPMSDIIPTALSQLTNDIGAVTDVNYVHTDNNFTNELKEKLEAMTGLELVPVDELPEASADTLYKIYLAPTADPQQQNVRDEFVTVSKEEDGVVTYEWEQIGSTAIDLSPYYTKTETDELLGGKVDKETGKGLSSNDYTSTEKAKLEGLENYDDTALAGRVSTVEGLLGGHRVEKDVPSDAKFTDTIYDDSALDNRLTTAEGNISANSTAISAETERAQGVEAGLRTDITEQEGIIQTKIAEVDAAKAATIAATTAANTATAATNTAISNAESATQAANTAAAATQAAIAQAERVNVELEGSTITVTDKEGNESSIDLLDATNERVYINVTTNKAEVSVEGIVINCYLNNDVDDPLQTTTNENGQCYLDIPNNYHYRLVFPTIAGCDPITDVTHIAHASERIVDVEYKETQDPYIKTGEYCIVSLKKKYNGVSQPLEGKVVTITKSGESPVQYTTDSNGDVKVDIPYGTEYTVTLPNVEDYYVIRNKYDYTFYASQSNRTVVVHYYHYDSGLFIVTSDGTPYSYDQWLIAEQEQRVTKEDAKLIMFATDILIGNNGVFAIDIDTYRNTNFNTSSYKKQWANSGTYTFTDIPTNGSVVSADYYYDGYTASVKIEAEATNVQSLSVPAASFCLSQSREVGGVTLPGFLGSPGQWEIFWNHKAEAESLMNVVRPTQEGQTVYSIGTYEKWTSAQINDYRACYFTNVKVNATNVYNMKTSSYVVIPFFAM